jgi:hypothetical protein
MVLTSWLRSRRGSAAAFLALAEALRPHRACPRLRVQRSTSARAAPIAQPLVGLVTRLSENQRGARSHLPHVGVTIVQEQRVEPRPQSVLITVSLNSAVEAARNRMR